MAFSNQIEFDIGKQILSHEKLFRFLSEHSDHFYPVLSEQVDIRHYSEKLYAHANLILGIDKIKSEIASLCAFYNDMEFAYLTLFVVVNHYAGTGLGKIMMNMFIDHIGEKKARLEVHGENIKAMRLYEKFNFTVVDQDALFLKMERIPEKHIITKKI